MVAFLNVIYAHGPRGREQYRTLFCTFDIQTVLRAEKRSYWIPQFSRKLLLLLSLSRRLASLSFVRILHRLARLGSPLFGAIYWGRLKDVRVLSALDEGQLRI